MGNKSIEKSDRLKGKAWINAYNKGDRLTKVAMLSHALAVHKVANYNYGYLSYMFTHKYMEYKELLEKVIKIKLETE